MKSIEITDIQAIRHVSIPVSESGGVIVLKGNQGTGKSTALQAVQALAGQKADSLSIRDGAKRGSIEFDGVKVIVTKSRTTRKGEMTFTIDSGRFDLSRIVDPQILDDERADAARIKQLLCLTGARPNPEAYWQLLREFLDPVEIDDLNIDDETDDPIDLHQRFVRAMQAVARKLEKDSDTIRVDIDEIKKKYQGLNLRTPPNVDDVRTAYDACVKADHELEERNRVSTQQQQDIAKAREAIDRLKSDYHGLTVADAEMERNEAEELAKQAHQAMIDAERHYKAKREALSLAEHELRIAKAHEQAVATTESVLKQTTVPPPSALEISESKEALETARDLLHRAMRANEGAMLVQDGEKKNMLADRMARNADEIRNACRRAEDILAASVKLQYIRVENNRLVVHTDRSESELFSELSHGERAILAIQEAARFVPPTGMLCVSQEIWGGIAPENKLVINDAAKIYKVHVLTAEVTDEDELSVEVME